MTITNDKRKLYLYEERTHIICTEIDLDNGLSGYKPITIEVAIKLILCGVMASDNTRRFINDYK